MDVLGGVGGRREGGGEQQGGDGDERTGADAVHHETGAPWTQSVFLRSGGLTPAKVGVYIAGVNDVHNINGRVVRCLTPRQEGSMHKNPSGTSRRSSAASARGRASACK